MSTEEENPTRAGTCILVNPDSMSREFVRAVLARRARVLIVSPVDELLHTCGWDAYFTSEPMDISE